MTDLSVKNKNKTMRRAAILGASGYTGAEMIRLLMGHPSIEIEAVTGHSRAGQAVADTYPHFAHYDLPAIVKLEDVNWGKIDVVFACLPHGTFIDNYGMIAQEVDTIIDLSADFRFDSANEYEHVYGRSHGQSGALANRIYGLTEYSRASLKGASLVACPGCYPTATLLALSPAIEANMIDLDSIIIDAKSGVTGAGRKAKTALIYSEVSDGAHAYGIGTHRHAPEIDQFIRGLSNAENSPKVRFTPHLIPMNRGMIATCYVDLAEGVSSDDLRKAYVDRYCDEPFVTMMPQGQAPQTRHVRGSNHVQIGVFADRVDGKAIIISAIDNLMKGSAGQALQNYNLTQGWDEALGLNMSAIFP
ncbi:MAG: N-acetyl-gamma-glutamyl-phosphate reductase [Maricaulaceae bacterium]